MGSDACLTRQIARVKGSTLHPEWHAGGMGWDRRFHTCGVGFTHSTRVERVQRCEFMHFEARNGMGWDRSSQNVEPFSLGPMSQKATSLGLLRTSDVDVPIRKGRRRVSQSRVKMLSKRCLGWEKPSRATSALRVYSPCTNRVKGTTRRVICTLSRATSRAAPFQSVSEQKCRKGPHSYRTIGHHARCIRTLTRRAVRSSEPAVQISY